MSSTDTFVDYYAILGVNPDAGGDTIQEEIKNQRKTWRKRQGLADDQARRTAEERISQLTEAENVLLNPTKRSEYDQRRKEQASQPQATPSRDSGSTTDWLVRAEEYLTMGDAMSAAYAAREATSERGDEHRAWAVRGRASLYQGDYQAALFELREALRLRPDEAEYHFDLGTIQEEMENFNAALQSYRKFAELAPDNPMGDIAIASVLVRTEQPKEAIEILDKVLAKDGDNAQAQYYLAIALYERCFELMDPTPFDTYINTREDQARQVLRCAERAQRLKVDDHEVRKEIDELVTDIRSDFELKVDRYLWDRYRADPFSGHGFLLAAMMTPGVLLALFVWGTIGAAGSGLAGFVLGAGIFGGWVWLMFRMQRRPQYEINRRNLERHRKGKL